MVDANNVPVGFAPGCKLRDEVEHQAAAPRQQRRRPCNKDVNPLRWTGLIRVGLVAVCTIEKYRKNPPRQLHDSILQLSVIDRLEAGLEFATITH